MTSLGLRTMAATMPLPIASSSRLASRANMRLPSARPAVPHTRVLSSTSSSVPFARTHLAAQPRLHRILAQVVARPAPASRIARLVPSRSFASQPTSASASANEQSSSTATEDDPSPGPNASASARLKAMFKKYGWYALGMYFALGLVDCGLVLVAVHTLGAERIAPVFDGVTHWYRVKRYGEIEADQMKADDLLTREKEALESKTEGKKNGGGWGPSKTFWAEFALAYAIHKTLLLPVRAGLTVAWTPKLVGWMTRRGWVGKGGLTRAASHAQGKVKDASDRVKERVKRQ